MGPGRAPTADGIITARVGVDLPFGDGDIITVHQVRRVCRAVPPASGICQSCSAEGCRTEAPRHVLRTISILHLGRIDQRLLLTSTGHRHAAIDSVRQSADTVRLLVGRGTTSATHRRRRQRRTTTMLQKRCMTFLPLVGLTTRVFLR